MNISKIRPLPNNEIKPLHISDLLFQDGATKSENKGAAEIESVIFKESFSLKLFMRLPVFVKGALLH